MTESHTPSRPRRTPLLIAILLLISTLGIGLVTRETPPRPRGATGGPVSTPPGGESLGGEGPVSLQLALDRRSVLAGGDGLVRLELSLQGEQSDAERRARVPTDFVVVLDRSSSMSGHPIELARTSVLTLMDGLGENDRLALVSYSNGARIDIPLETANAGTRGRWSRAVSQVAAGGGTNMSSGLDLAHQLVQTATRQGRVARVILLSDGHANTGDHSLEGLRARAERAIVDDYVISTIGLGSGFDETVMSTIADAGTGNFHYLPDTRELASIFDDEFASARETVASALRVVFTPGDDVTLQEVAGYPLTPEGPEGNAVAFHPGALFAGQERRLWLTLRAPTHSPGALALGALAVRYDDSAGQHRELVVASLPTLSCVEGETDYYASFDKDVYRRSSGEVLGSLKRRVAKRMKAGDPRAAAADVSETLAELEQDQLRALGYAVASDVAAFESLEDTVSAPEASSPAVQNLLGKQLLEEGLNESRVGAKR